MLTHGVDLKKARQLDAGRGRSCAEIEADVAALSPVEGTVQE